MNASEHAASEPPRCNKSTDGPDDEAAFECSSPLSQPIDHAALTINSSPRGGDPRKLPPPATFSPRRRRGRQPRLRRNILDEFRKAPIATTVALVGIIALFPVGATALRTFTDDELNITQSPISFRTGQNSILSVIVPESASKLRPWPSYFEDPIGFDEWAASRNGVRAQDVELSFVARSDMSEATLITDVRVVVLRRETSLSGTWFGVDAGGEQSNRIIYANLDDSPPSVTRSPGWDYPLSVSSRETEIFTVVAATQQCYCYWRAEVDAVTPDGDKVTILVDDNGEPFEVTGTNHASARISVD